MITLENKRIADFITEKDTLVSEGRKISQDIENIEAKIKGYEEKEKKITSKVEVPKDLLDKGNALDKEVKEKFDELVRLGKEVQEFKLKAVPEDMKKAHLALMAEKEEKERERNKIALKVQKIKDRVVPLIQKHVKPILKDEYDDVETAKVKDGKVVISTFNHLKDWKAKFHR